MATCFCEKLWKRSRRRLLGRRSLQTGEEELGGNQLSWSLKHGVIFCLFFAAKSLQETSMRRMLWSNHHHSGPVFFDRYIFQCCIWYMSNLQHVIQILFRQPRKPLHHSKTYAHHVYRFLCHFIWAFVLCILVKFKFRCRFAIQRNLIFSKQFTYLQSMVSHWPDGDLTC